MFYCVLVFCIFYFRAASYGVIKNGDSIILRANWSVILNYCIFVSPKTRSAEIARVDGYYAFQGHSRLLKINDFGTNRKLICHFLIND